MTPAPAGLSRQGVAAWERLAGPPIAHRGLWSADPADGRPENSLSAFRAAAAAGYGIELDVRLSADGVPVVFHDAELRRLTEEDGLLEARTAAELGVLTLRGTAETIPTLAEALEAIGADTLALVEVKADSGPRDALPDAVAPLVLAHPGPLAVIGFGRRWHARFGALHPGVLRGHNYGAADAHTALSNDHAVHFSLPGLDALNGPETAELRAGGRVLVAWTARTPEQFAHARKTTDNVIFEGFVP